MKGNKMETCRKRTTLYGNGQKESEGYFVNDNRHGKWIWWNDDGTIKLTKWYDRWTETTEAAFEAKYPGFHKKHKGNIND